MAIPIYIPSRSRASTFNKSTLIKIPRSRYKDTVVVVPAGQLDDYHKVIEKNFPGVELISCPIENNIALKRQWIGQLAEREGQEKFAFFDDDVIVWTMRERPDNWKLIQCTEADRDECLDWMESALDNYSHVSFSPRGNNLLRNSSGFINGPKPFTFDNVRLLRVIGYRTKDYLDVEHGRVKFMEDFDVTLQLLRQGKANISSWWWAQDQRQTGLPGGCQDYRTLQAHEEAALKLKELHPDFVSLRKTKNVTKVRFNPDFQDRTEVTIRWKKAYEWGLNNARNQS